MMRRALLLTVMIAGAVRGQSTLTVPGTHPTIQAAIVAAAPGDSIVVAPGIYAGPFDFLGAAVTLRSAQGAAATILDGNFTATVVTFAGGEGPTSVLEGFTVRNGSTLTNGGGIVCQGTSPTIRDCIIESNDAPGTASGPISGNGGGVFLSLATPLFQRCIIRDNTAGFDGGGVALDSSSPTFESCVVTGNIAAVGGGGFACSSFSQLIVVNSMIAQNSCAGAGGGIWCQDSPLHIHHSTVTANTAGGGGAIHVGGITVVFATNDILWGNTPPQLTLSTTSTTIVSSSNVQGGFPGTSNVDLNPGFVDFAGGDFHLALGSPCLNLGDPLSPWLPATDFEGDARVIDGGVDLGADELAGALGPCGAGTVGLASGGPFDVLLVDGMPGLIGRIVPVNIGQPFTIDVLQPTTNPNPAPFVLWGRLGVPAPQEVWPLPFGDVCFTPFHVAPTVPGLFNVANAFANDPTALFVASPGAWTVTIAGLGFPLDFTLQGVIQDSGAATNNLAVTNGVVVTVR